MGLSSLTPGLAVTAVVCLVVQTGAAATTYEAICGQEQCQIEINASGIGGPAGFIPTPYILEWNQGKLNSYNKAKGIAGGFGGATAGLVGGALLLGPVGALGGLVGGAIVGADAGKEFEGYFTVVGYTETGEKISHAFYFVNPKTARRLRIELPVVTGLGAGQQRSVAEIESAYNKADAEVTATAGAPQRLGDTARRSKVKDISKGCWEEYLAGNPAMSVWAAANPGLAEQQRKISGYQRCK